MGERILLVEDHPLVAAGLASGLRAQDHEVHVRVVTEPVAADAITLVLEQVLPSMVLLDLDLGSVDGVQLIPGILAIGARVVVVTGVTDRLRLARAMEAGAAGWVSKARPFEDLLEALSRLLSGQPILDGNERMALLQELRSSRQAVAAAREPFERLTAAQRDVLCCIIEGLSAKQIASQRRASLSTVRTHIRHVLTGLGVRSQLEAVALARRVGWPSRPA